MTEKLVLVNPDVYTLWNYRKEILNEFKTKDAPELTPAGKEDQQQGNQTLEDVGITCDKIQQVTCDQQEQINSSANLVMPCGKDDDTDTQEEVKSENITPSVFFNQLCKQELTLTQNCLMKQPKSYPVWHHRLWLVTNFIDKPDWQAELELCKEALNYDSRNFHTWDYRREILKFANIPIQNEIEFTSEKIRQNFSNFSSWYNRSSLLTQASLQGSIDMKELWDEEYSLVENAIFTDPTDQSAWFYHKWLSSINLGSSLNTTLLRDELAMQLVICSSSDNLLAVKFNRATDVCPSFKIKLQPSALVYSSEVIMTVSESSYKQNIWTASRELIDLSLAQSIEITSLAIDSNSLLIPLKKDTIVVAKSRQQNIFDNNTNLRLKEANIESLRALQQEEPESKWINWTLSFFGDTQVKLQTLETLCKLDPLRFNYYQDQKSRLIINSKLKELPSSNESSNLHLNLASSGLTKMFYTSQLIHLRSIDLTSNNLTSFKRDFSTFVALEVLILDSNEISSIDKGIYLPSLKILSMQKNRIKHSEQLNNLNGCKRLNCIHLFGNPISDDADEKLKLVEKFSIISYEEVTFTNLLNEGQVKKVTHIDF